MHPPTTPFEPTPPVSIALKSDIENLKHAIEQAKLGASEGGVSIGGAVVDKDGNVLGVGRNKRVQEKSAILHGETDCLNNIGRLHASKYVGATMYTTLSPCTMCSGAVVLFGISRVVMGENSTFVGGEDFLKSRGVEVVNLDLDECKQLKKNFIDKYPEIWNEDIGEE
ncbi:cytidine deaminase-like protein [Dacryopinax primogenitus]|uniref:Cytosine deaminase n=1 Tax=Dacryopinax primogenitus (strain DJM 731) TaxID=1858805 RepID=M5FU63_DACPD|nr:cytidine deaminase-like protein [Dacryopinax primogenitus]EJU01231.1 cytidine deaminase-like protein [Dacryopinax primogenitus]